MVFSSYLFLFAFLPAVLAVYYLLPTARRNLFLTLASYVFYGWANPLFVLLLLFSTGLDYCAGLLITGARRGEPGEIPLLPANAPRTRFQRGVLVASLASNLLLLGFFKYFNFGIDSYNAVVSFLGLSGGCVETALRVTLPLGISFYTFQSMSYIIDVYRGETRAIRSLTDYACFVAMFPQLVAGPIIRFREISAQLHEHRPTLERFARGIAFFGVGLAKKVILANPCGRIADTVFNGGTGTCLDAWYGAAAYAFQIYFDFSGYSDMAIGLGLMFGFVFPRNFDSPYHAQSLTEFWRRWHISLSSWLRDNLYIPLGGNRHGERRACVNVMLVMLLGGLWHGAAWKFVAWGGLHGAVLVTERRLAGFNPRWRLPAPLRMARTFLTVLFAWVFFRSADLGAALSYCGRMLGLVRANPAATLMDGVIHRPYYLLTLLAAGIVIWVAPQSWNWTRTLTPFKAVITVILLGTSILLLGMQTYNPFIYFIF